MAPGRSRLGGVATGYGAAGIAVAVGALRSAPSAWQLMMAVLAAFVAAAVAVSVARPRARGWVVVGPVVGSGAAVLYDVTPLGLATLILALVAGAAVGLVARRPWRPWRWTAVGAAAGIASVVIVRAAISMRWALVTAVAGLVVAAVAGLVDRAVVDVARRWGTTWPPPVAALVAVALMLGWTGANNSQLSWFGAVIAHGPTSGNDVAITFDDGPNATTTLAVRDILDLAGVKATFFLVGKALDQRPDIARALLGDGMLLGGHSYHHDAWRWLDPRYPELDRTLASFRRQLGVCPRFYRPPHGQRTPFLEADVHDAHMDVALWGVSAGDWATTDGALVADRVLRQVRPGSIILLHDGLDGDVTADRSVLLDALPRILAGLRTRGLQPVTLDQLVGGAGYNASC